MALLRGRRGGGGGGKLIFVKRDKPFLVSVNRYVLKKCSVNRGFTP